MEDLTSLFGMGRGEHLRHNHHKIVINSRYAAVRENNFTSYFSLFTIIIKYILGSCKINFFATLSLFKIRIKKIKAYGQLVLLGFDVTIFTPAAYQRHSL